MPKTIIDYSKTIIYKIVCNDLNITDLYVGHTTQFTKRKCGHKSKCNNLNSKSYNLIIYKTIRDNGGWENWSMIEIEKYNCNDSNEATARERHWYEILQAKLNSCCPYRSKGEYMQEYRENNKNKISQQRQEYNKTVGQQKREEYKEMNKNKIKEYKTEYNKMNKDKIREYNKAYRVKSKLKKLNIEK